MPKQTKYRIVTTLKAYYQGESCWLVLIKGIAIEADAKDISLRSMYCIPLVCPWKTLSSCWQPSWVIRALILHPSNHPHLCASAFTANNEQDGHTGWGVSEETFVSKEAKLTRVWNVFFSLQFWQSHYLLWGILRKPNIRYQELYRPNVSWTVPNWAFVRHCG